jgi:hypothetical protein
MIPGGVHQPKEQESSDLDDVLKGHDFTCCGKTHCFERARLQPCRKRNKTMTGFSPGGMYPANFTRDMSFTAASLVVP